LTSYSSNSGSSNFSKIFKNDVKRFLNKLMKSHSFKWN